VRLSRPLKIHSANFCLASKTPLLHFEFLKAGFVVIFENCPQYELAA